jgi:TRAP-type C4-dicarboxylate transport system substrate-binding protein
MNIHRGTLYTLLLLLVAIILGLGIYRFAALNTSAASTKPVQVRWLLSHQPTEVFARATAVFADELSKQSGGDLSLKVVMPQDIGQKSGDVSNEKVFQLLDSGEVELATTYTVALAQTDVALGSLNLPFLFNSYTDVSPVLDGSFGQSLLNTIGQKTSAQGLAFTMSGGFRIIASKNTAIRTPSDMKGLRIATSGGPVAEATLKALGAIPVPTDLEKGVKTFDPATIDGIETTYSRLSSVLGTDTEYTKYLNETNHSMFLTVILANTKFFNSLSANDQAALRKAALAAAAVEREDSEALGATTKQALIAKGSTIVMPEQGAAFKSATKPVYDQFKSVFGEDMLKQLSALGY